MVNNAGSGNHRAAWSEEGGADGVELRFAVNSSPGTRSAGTCCRCHTVRAVADRSTSLVGQQAIDFGERPAHKD